MSQEPIAITDLTRMRGDRVCIAGYQLKDGTPVRCIRPLLRRGVLTEAWLYVGNEPAIRPFAVVEIDLEQARPTRPHSEDWLVHPSYRQHLRMLDRAERLALLDLIEDPSIDAIFGAPVMHDHGWYVTDGTGERSLGTIRPTEIQEVVYRQRPDGSWDYRLAFRDRAGAYYRLAVTDLAYRYYLDFGRAERGLSALSVANRMSDWLNAGRDIRLRIGLARHWGEYPDRCFLQITGIYTEPDYLSGRCFADFRRLTPEEVDMSEVPF